MQENTDIVEKLNNHRLPVDEGYWAEMEKRLLSDHKKVVPLWAWLAGTGMAASLALLLMVGVFSSDDENAGAQVARIEHEEYRENKESKENKVDNEQAVGTQMAQITQISANKEKSVKSTQSAPSLSSLSSLPSLPLETSATPQDTTPPKQYELKPQYNDDFLIAHNQPEKRKPQNKKSWQLAAAFGSSASSSPNDDLAFSNQKMDYSSKEYGYDAVVYHSAESAPSLDEVFSGFPEVTHLPPLSFGVTVRKSFTEHLAFETGLTYSFLHSKFKDNNQWQPREATLKLHYLGIPFNFVAYALNKPKWNVYFSVGAMIEKGIMLDYVQTTHQNYYYYYDDDQPFHTISLQDDIPGLQLSYNASFGIGYKFYRDISVYFEPRIIYYLENNQPVSVRTEMPLQVGLSAGLRFDF